MKTILCPVDFSPASDAAVSYAGSLAMHLDASVTLLHIYELPVLYGDAPFLAMQQLNDEIKTVASNNLSKAERSFKDQFGNVDVHIHLQNGNPASAIQNYAAEISADIIVMGTKGMTAMERLLIGSTTERVFHHSSIPVLCIPQKSRYKSIENIIYATDLEEDNLSAASKMIDFADALNATVKFIYVDTGKNHPSQEELMEKIRKHIHYPKVMVAVIKDESVSKGLQNFGAGHPADVLAMFTHQRNFPRALVTPSVTNQTLHHLELPLLVLPPL